MEELICLLWDAILAKNLFMFEAIEHHICATYFPHYTETMNAVAARELLPIYVRETLNAGERSICAAID